jgi:uncharacterized protein YgiM (DUF1202 family)
MRLRLLAVSLAILASGWAPLFAQSAVVKHNVNLRVDPSTHEEPVRLLKPPEELTLLSPSKVSGYYHVITAEGESGWVWANRVEVGAGPGTCSCRDCGCRLSRLRT